jgi:elongation factor G
VVRMHADEMEDIPGPRPGTSSPSSGSSVSRGHLHGRPVNYSHVLHVCPEPVISLTITPKDNKASTQMSKALNRLPGRTPPSAPAWMRNRGDDHLRHGGAASRNLCGEDEAGVQGRSGDGHASGSLPRGDHAEGLLSITPTRNRPEGRVSTAGSPGLWSPPRAGVRVRQPGEGRGDPYRVHSRRGQGISGLSQKGDPSRLPDSRVKVTVNDGQSHSVDSSELAFRQAAIGAFKQAYMKAKPVILEPIMKVAVECPSEFPGKRDGFHQSAPGTDHEFHGRRGVYDH